MCEAELELLFWLAIQRCSFTRGGMPSQPKKYTWLPSLVDRALVLLETSHDLGCGLQEVILCSNFQCTPIAQSLVRPPSEEQSQLRSAEEFALLEEYIETG